MVRVIRFHEYGGPEVLRIENVDVSPPGEGEVQIRVKALGLNRAEALLRAGTYIEPAIFPSGLGLEAAGVVAEVEERPTKQQHDCDGRERADHVFPVHQSSAVVGQVLPDTRSWNSPGYRQW